MKIRQLLITGLASLLAFSCAKQDELSEEVSKNLTSQDFTVADNGTIRVALAEAGNKLSFDFSEKDDKNVVYSYNGTCQEPIEKELREENKVLRIKVETKQGEEVNKKVWLAFNANFEEGVAKIEPQIYFDGEVSNLNLPMTTEVKTYQEIFNGGEAQHRKLTMRGSLLQFKLTNDFAKAVTLHKFTIKNGENNALAFKGSFTSPTEADAEFPKFTAETVADIVHPSDITITAGQSKYLYLWGMPVKSNGKLVFSYQVREEGGLAFASREFEIPASFFANLKENQFKKLEHTIQVGEKLTFDPETYYYVRFARKGMVLQDVGAYNPSNPSVGDNQAICLRIPITTNNINNAWGSMDQETHERQLWKFVGNGDDFELINKKTGRSLYIIEGSSNELFVKSKHGAKGHLKLFKSTRGPGKYELGSASSVKDFSGTQKYRTLNEIGGGWNEVLKTWVNTQGNSDEGNDIILEPETWGFELPTPPESPELSGVDGSGNKYYAINFTGGKGDERTAVAYLSNQGVNQICKSSPSADEAALWKLRQKEEESNIIYLESRQAPGQMLTVGGGKAKVTNSADRNAWQRLVLINTIVGATVATDTNPVPVYGSILQSVNNTRHGLSTEGGYGPDRNIQVEDKWNNKARVEFKRIETVADDKGAEPVLSNGSTEKWYYIKYLNPEAYLKAPTNVGGHLVTAEFAAGDEQMMWKLQGNNLNNFMLINKKNKRGIAFSAASGGRFTVANGVGNRISTHVIGFIDGTTTSISRVLSWNTGGVGKNYFCPTENKQICNHLPQKSANRLVFIPVE